MTTPQSGFSNILITLVVGITLVIGIGFIAINYLKEDGIPKEYRETPPPPAADTGTSDKCIVTGCSAHICAKESVITTCEFKPEYACYQNVRCELQSDGACAWTQTPELLSCIAQAQKSPPPPAQPTPKPKIPPPAPPQVVPPQTTQPPPTPPTPSSRSFTIEADDSGFYPTSVLTVPKGPEIILTFQVRSEGVYYGGLTFRAPLSPFPETSALPGESAAVSFTADKPFTISSYWPSSDVWKADLRIEVR
ncbi:MAG: hypothetical protein G01um101466_737 [Parcubacteria group bacterium Gr01-1014_66]|nr:MAG: hypothetical protein G01um101466_737 [Parcubacteria group bacterium Gr01-1014_66]